MILRQLFTSMFRTKKSSPPVHSLSACLTTLDLTSLGIGSILGAGTYVVAGQVAKNIAGPAVIISFSIAAFSSLLSGLCYAEFGARVPKTTGSAYAYSYSTVGQFTAYIIGWNLILEYMIGTAADARALSGSIDFITGNKIQTWLVTNIGTVPGTGSYPDVLGFIVTIITTIILAIGVKSSARYTLLFNGLNIAVVLFVIIVGCFFIDFDYWEGTDQFFPYGAHGVFAGAASCFYAFVGFDIIATTGAEAITPGRSIPIAIVTTLIICYIAYIGVSSVMSLMIPVTSLVSDAPLAEAFDLVGAHWAKYLVGLGAVFGLASSLLGSMFPLPRIIFSMANDGLLFNSFTKVSMKTETPIRATVIPGIMTACFTLLFDLAELVEMMSIGTLLAYTLVCVSVLILRYQDSRDYLTIDNATTELKNPLSDDEENESDEIHSSEQRYRCVPKSVTTPTDSTSRKVIISTVSLSVLFLIFSIIMTYTSLSPLTGVILVLISAFIIAFVITIYLQPRDVHSEQLLTFKVPLVPWLPLTAIFINISLMVRLSHITWLRFIVWITLGLILYFSYGLRRATDKLNTSQDEQESLLESSPNKRDVSQP